ncbi:hypothetical protein [Bacteroides sp.]|uniref:hypothetical protein n=1 Tax=Bacteroides sp. TaxID=29523 RepID=UPI0025BC35E6|nr:hypothetical protein [Bacteroides sp.]
MEEMIKTAGQTAMESGKEVNNTSSVESFNNKETMTTENQTTALIKYNAVEQAQMALEEKKRFLADNANADKNIIKSAQVNINKAEKEYAEALKSVKLPITHVEVWEVKESTADCEIISKKKSEIIIAVSNYNMATTKANTELGKELIQEDKFEKQPLFVTEAELFYKVNIELKDLNGNTIPKDTPNVYVPVDNANQYWQWQAYHEANINSIVKDEQPLTIENVRIKKFESLQEFAQYRGINNVLSRGFNGLEKAGNAALATQNEFYQKVFEVAIELNASISTIVKYYYHGKLLKGKVWNNAMLGVVVDNFQYDLNVGDKIIKTLQDKAFKSKTIKERYMIDAITQFANYTPQGATEKIGIDETLKVIQSLSKEDVRFIEVIPLDKVNEIYSVLLTQYLKNQGILKSEATA